jgi:hypothetical protein
MGTTGRDPSVPQVPFRCTRHPRPGDCCQEYECKQDDTRKNAQPPRKKIVYLLLP